MKSYLYGGDEYTSINIIKSTKNPDVLVITPLLNGHKISRDTQISIKRNYVKYFWIAVEGNNNIPTNLLQGLNWADSDNLIRKPKYYIMIDNDITLGRNMLDKLFKKLEASKNELVSYSYASFRFEGSTNFEFPAVPFDAERLKKVNYISSNSMFKWNIWKEIGLVTDEKYKRLLDWAFLLKCLSKGYIGIPVPEANFIAKSNPDSISSGSSQDYFLKHKRVIDDFVKPFFN